MLFNIVSRRTILMWLLKHPFSATRMSMQVIVIDFHIVVELHHVTSCRAANKFAKLFRKLNLIHDEYFFISKTIIQIGDCFTLSMTSAIFRHVTLRCVVQKKNSFNLRSSLNPQSYFCQPLQAPEFGSQFSKLNEKTFSLNKGHSLYNIMHKLPWQLF